MIEAFADVNGIKLCYEERGEGDPVLLVHGFGGNKEGWIAQWIPLSEHFRVIRFDNRNGGCSDRPNQPNTSELLADDVSALMDYLNLERTHVIGWSMGGIIVQNFAKKYPNRINKLILINTVMGAPDNHSIEIIKTNHLKELEERKIDPVKTFWKSARLGYYIKFRKEMEANPKKKFYGLWSVEDLIQNENLNPPTPQDIINQSRALLQTITIKDLKQIKNPTLLITSSHDRLTSSKSMIEMHQAMPNSTLKVIEKAGHNSPVSKAPEVNEAIINFLKS
ncbi:MAG: alpha/beta fold hydrolase [Candidatus Hermodarchaeota archaeon]